MNLTDALPENELLLAQLVISKLAKVMHGLLSVGTATLAMNPSTAFLEGREKTPLGFLEVLSCLGVRPGHADKISLLREHVRRLAAEVSRFHALFMALGDWRTCSPQDLDAAVHRLADGYTRFCLRLSEFASMVGMDADYSLQARQDSSYLIASFRTFSAQ